MLKNIDLLFPKVQNILKIIQKAIIIYLMKNLVIIIAFLLLSQDDSTLEYLSMELRAGKQISGSTAATVFFSNFPASIWSRL